MCVRARARPEMFWGLISAYFSSVISFSVDHLSENISDHQSVQWPLLVTFYPSVCLFTCLSACLPVCLSVYLPFCLYYSVWLPVSLFTCLPTCWRVRQVFSVYLLMFKFTLIVSHSHKQILFVFTEHLLPWTQQPVRLHGDKNQLWVNESRGGSSQVSWTVWWDHVCWKSNQMCLWAK